MISADPVVGAADLCLHIRTLATRYPDAEVIDELRTPVSVLGYFGRHDTAISEHLRGARDYIDVQDLDGALEEILSAARTMFDPQPLPDPWAQLEREIVPAIEDRKRDLLGDDS